MSSTEVQDQTTKHPGIVGVGRMLRNTDFGPRVKATAIEDVLIHVADGDNDLEPRQVIALAALLAHYDAQMSIQVLCDPYVNV